MRAAGWFTGVAQRQVPFLQIPLHADYHVGNFGIDSGMGVPEWERRYGRQVDMLNWVDEQLRYPMTIWELARRWDAEHRGKSHSGSRGNGET